MARTAKKTAKKPTRKVAAKLAKTSKVVVKKSVSNQALSMISLYRLNLLSGVTSVLLAALSAFLLVSTTVQLLMSYMTRDVMADQSAVVLAPAVQVFTEVELRYVLSGIFAVGAIGSLLLATALRSRYEAKVAAGNSCWRWAFTGLSSALLLVFTSLLAGVTDIATLKLVGGLILATVFLSWTAERQNLDTKAPQWLAYIAALITGAWAWIPLGVSLIGTSVYGLERFGWHVYALAGAGLIGCIAIAVNQYLHISGRKQWDNYLFVERNYLVIDLLIKIAAAGIILAALHK